MSEPYPCEQTGKDRSGKTVKKYSYVATLTEIGGYNVVAVRFDGYERKTDVYQEIRAQFPEWRIKNVLRLYDEDFKEAQ